MSDNSSASIAPVGRVKSGWLNHRQRILLTIGAGVLLLICITVYGSMMESSAYATDYSAKHLAPSLAHPFGTDHLGRDMFTRTIAGLSTSIQIGLLAAFASSIIALILGTLSAVFGGKVDSAITFLVDLCMGIPHIVLLLLIALAVGGGAKGVILGVTITHWPNLTRVIRAEVMQVRSSQFIASSRKLGKSSLFIASRHIFPHVFPQYLVGLVLLFPHAILHEAAITFLGYGLPLDAPAVGIILAESMKYLVIGSWWLAVFPGLALLLVTGLFDMVGGYLKIAVDPYSARE